MPRTLFGLISLREAFIAIKIRAREEERARENKHSHLRKREMYARQLVKLKAHAEMYGGYKRMDSRRALALQDTALSWIFRFLAIFFSKKGFLIFLFYYGSV